MYCVCIHCKCACICVNGINLSANYVNFVYYYVNIKPSLSSCSLMLHLNLFFFFFFFFVECGGYFFSGVADGFFFCWKVFVYVKVILPRTCIILGLSQNVLLFMYYFTNNMWLVYFTVQCFM